MVAEVQSNTITDNYLRGINLIRRTATSETEYYLFNAHGDVVTTTNPNGTINQSYDYDAFGNEKDPNPLDTNPFRYRGEYLDVETGNYYLRARYYDPTRGRFTQEDPILAGLNWYTYCKNNPVFFSDPSGLDAVVLNKPVDNAANIIGVEHMAGFFQDENGDWWFFSWGDVVHYVKVDDPSIFDSIDKINKWLIDYRYPDDPDLRLLNEDNPYRNSVYIKGDFTASRAAALEYLNQYSTSKDVNRKISNIHYNLLLKNCTQVTMELLMMSTLPSGLSVSNYLFINNHAVSLVPNFNMSNLQNVFYNSATNLQGFNEAINTQAKKFDGCSWIIQLWYGQLKANIEAIR